MTKEEYQKYTKKVEKYTENLTAFNNIQEEPYFSWLACNCCERPFGGDRFDCLVVNVGRVGNPVEQHNNICSDCHYFSHFGKLDDSAMQEIESSSQIDKLGV